MKSTGYFLIPKITFNASYSTKTKILKNVSHAINSYETFADAIKQLKIIQNIQNNTKNAKFKVDYYIAQYEFQDSKFHAYVKRLYSYKDLMKYLILV